MEACEENEDIVKLLDKKVDGWQSGLACDMCAIAYKCLEMNRKHRPQMSEVGNNHCYHICLNKLPHSIKCPFKGFLSKSFRSLYVESKLLFKFYDFTHHTGPRIQYAVCSATAASCLLSIKY